MINNLSGNDLPPPFTERPTTRDGRRLSRLARAIAELHAHFGDGSALDRASLAADQRWRLDLATGEFYEALAPWFAALDAIRPAYDAWQRRRGQWRFRNR